MSHCEMSSCVKCFSMHVSPTHLACITEVSRPALIDLNIKPMNSLLG